MRKAHCLITDEAREKQPTQRKKTGPRSACRCGTRRCEQTDVLWCLKYVFCARGYLLRCMACVTSRYCAMCKNMVCVCVSHKFWGGDQFSVDDSEERKCSTSKHMAKELQLCNGAHILKHLKKKRHAHNPSECMSHIDKGCHSCTWRHCRLALRLCFA